MELKVNMNEYLPLRDVVYNTLRQAILRGELKPGERLMEIQLANKLGVSRTPVREAIRKLELDGLVLSAKLLSAGWVRGKILDAGFFSSYYRIDGRFGAELTFSGASVGYESGEVTVEHLYFYRFPDNIGDGGDLERFRRENRCRPEDISPRYYSEVVMEIAGVAE